MMWKEGDIKDGHKLGGEVQYVEYCESLQEKTVPFQQSFSRILLILSLD